MAKITINKVEYDLDKDRKSILLTLQKLKVIRFETKEEETILEKLLEDAKYTKKSLRQVVIICKRCKERYKSFTDGGTNVCSCNTVYWKSNGATLDIQAPRETFFIILNDPTVYDSKTFNRDPDL